MAYNDMVSMFGIGVRSGKFILGTCACEKAIAKKKLKLLLLDKGLAEKTIENFERLSISNGNTVLAIENDDFYKITNMNYKVLGVSDKSFASALIDKYYIPCRGIEND